jgi:o-succinylbenzoate---CoA ligase
MSVSSKPATGIQADWSKISDTTKQQDKGHNRPVIEWLLRRRGSAPFLVTPDRVWTYAEMAREVAKRVTIEPVMVRPRLDPSSVIEVLAGISGGGVVVTAPSSLVTGRDPVSTFQPGDKLVVFTSGTTGPPKGVRLTMANLEAASLASVRHLGHGPDDSWLLAMPLHHVGGLSILVRSAFTGGSVRLAPSSDPAVMAAAMRGGVSMVSVVATMLVRVLDHDPGPYHGLRAVLIGGGPIPEGLLERAVAAGVPALPSYGMTETFGQVATLLPGSSPEHKVHPLPGVELRIEPDGRIAVAGDQVSPGYLGEPERVGRWLVTNDLGEIDPDGALRVLGRSDTIVLTGGENVDPARVEAELSFHPGAGEVMVVGVPDPEWGVLLACLHTGTASAEELAGWLRKRVAGPMVPKRWVPVSSLPRTDLGKPDRPAAVALCLGGSGG